MNDLNPFPDMKILINSINRDLEKTFLSKIPFVIPKSYPMTLGYHSNLQIRLAQTKREIKQAQKLRYKIFYKEMGAIADLKSMLKQRDIDAYDEYCDHLLIVDTKYPRKRFPGTPQYYKEKIVGTYRLLRQDVAEKFCGFYSSQEFPVQELIDRHPDKKFLELGRSCVDPEYRDKRTIELLWRGISWYIDECKIDVLIGCASLEGRDPDKHNEVLSFLYQNAQVKTEWQITNKGNMNILSDIDTKRALHNLPTLIKGYMRCGARFGGDYVIDHQFNTVDVFVVLPVKDITPKYREHFSIN